MPIDAIQTFEPLGPLRINTRCRLDQHGVKPWPKFFGDMRVIAKGQLIVIEMRGVLDNACPLPTPCFDKAVVL